MKTIIQIFFLILSYWTVAGHDCAFHQYAHSNHYKSKKMDAKKFFEQHLHIGQKTQQHGRLLYGAGRPPMRITLNTDDFATIKASVNGQAQTTTQNLNFLLRAMNVAKNFYQNRLKVTSSATIIPPVECYDFNTTDQNGIGASDLHIYVRYITNSQIGYGATGVSCEWNPLSGVADPNLSAGRPIVGRIIYNTYNLVDSVTSFTNRLFASITSTSIHETLHILGFDQSLYQNYLDSNTGLPYSYNITQQVVLHASRVGGANHILKTPFVKAWALAYFGCVNVTGMPLQNQQPGHVRGSHWQRLAMYDQLMTGTQLGPQKIFSGLTFAMLKDMGWYGVDDTFNDTTNYGNQKGCQFFFGACYSNTTSFPKYFCNPASNANVSQCSSTFSGKATCDSQTALMADGCGLWAQYFNCVDPDIVGDFYQSYTLQSFGTNSFCAKGTIANAGIATTYRSRCYPYVCNQTTQTITFTIGPYTLNCFNNQQGVLKTVTGMQGSFQCPIFQDYCMTARKICPNWCSKNGFCTRGICNCYSNSTVVYSGADCSITTCTVANTYYHAPTSSCVGTCPTGYYVNIRSKSCLPCDRSCNNCRDQSTICTSCVSTPSNPQYFYAAANICVGQCPNTTFLQVDTCIACNSGVGCATCSGSATFCTSCTNPAHYLNQLGNCGTACSVGFYTLYDDVNMKCRQSCPNTLWLSGGHCIRCTPLFKVVDDPNNACVPNCPAGYYTDNTTYICGNCNQTCAACDGPYAQNCTSCSPTGIYNYKHLKMCISTCPNGYYADTVALQCQRCIVQLHCATCSYSAGNVTCDTCQYQYFINANRTCTISCDPTYYQNNWNHSCDSCSNQCADCNGPYPSSCLTCVAPKYYLKNSTGGYCLDSCPGTGYVTFMSTTCLPCHQTCRTCINQTSSGCVTCADGLYLQNNLCRYVCSPGMYPNTVSMTCLTCDNKCQFCFGSTVDNCTQCQTGYVLDNFTCTTSCPTGQTPNNYSVCDIATTFERLIKISSFMILLIVWIII